MNRLSMALGMACVVVVASASAQRALDQDNVVILLDGSGSMSETMNRVVKMDAAKAAIEKVLTTVPPSTQVGLLVFTGKGSQSGWVHPLGPRDDDALRAGLRRVSSGGGTPLGRYIKLGADRLLAQREAQLGYGTYRLLVVTDGQASDTDKMNRFAPEVPVRGITLDVIGVDMKDHHLLATMAHSYRRADDAAALESAIAEVLAEVGGDDAAAAMDEAFDLLDGFPVEAAQAALEALATTGNTPLGDDPAYRPGPRPAAADTHTPGAASGSSSSPVVRGRISLGEIVVGVVVVIMAFNFVKKFRKD